MSKFEVSDLENILKFNMLLTESDQNEVSTVHIHEWECTT